MKFNKIRLKITVINIYKRLIKIFWKINIGSVVSFKINEVSLELIN